MQHLLLKGKALEKRGEEENRVALIKSLIMRDRKSRAWGARIKCDQNWSENVS